VGEQGHSVDMSNTIRLLDPWMMVGEAALLLLIFLAVFVWNAPRRRRVNASAFATARGVKAP
jgi:uncharacterized membrane protein YhfC